MKNTLPAKKSPLAARPVIAFCLLSCIFTLLLSSVALAGSVVAWGYNYNGQCNVPLPNVGFIAISSNWYHSLGLKNDGSIIAWGSSASS
jgi:hypothetical protein